MADNVSESYLKKWKVFYDFLQNEKLNIEIQIMICFGKWFYKKIMFFLIGKATTIQDSLLNKFKVSEMPDKVKQCIGELQTAIEHPDEVFIEELLLAYEILPENEFINLANRIKNGLIKTLEVFKQ